MIGEMSEIPNSTDRMPHGYFLNKERPAYNTCICTDCFRNYSQERGMSGCPWEAELETGSIGKKIYFHYITFGTVCIIFYCIEVYHIFNLKTRQFFPELLGSTFTNSIV